MNWCTTCGAMLAELPCQACGGITARDAYGRPVRSGRFARLPRPARAAIAVAATCSLLAAGVVSVGVATGSGLLPGVRPAAAHGVVPADAYGPVGDPSGPRGKKKSPSAKPSTKPQAPARRIPGRPPPGVEAAAEPLGRPLPPPKGTESYGFLMSQPQSESPVTWDPCRPIHYVVSGTAPAAAERALTEGMAELARVTGFRIVRDGATSEKPAATRASYQPKRYGERWAPILVAWSDETSAPFLSGSVVGYARPKPVKNRDGRLTYVTGEFVLEKPWFAALARSSNPKHRTLMRSVVIHEMAHMLGLAHIWESDQIMFPEAQLRIRKLGDGDRRGLYRLATGRCSPDL